MNKRQRKKLRVEAAKIIQGFDGFIIQAWKDMVVYRVSPLDLYYAKYAPWCPVIAEESYESTDSPTT